MDPNTIFTKPQQAYALYYNIMHDMWRSCGPEAHPLWKEAWKKECALFEELINSMGPEEKAEITKLLLPHKPLIPFASRALKQIK